MSCTAVKVVDKHGEVLTEEEIKNSSGITIVWDALYKKYCENPERYFMSDPNREARLKEAAEKATEGERACLTWTYDYVWVARKNIPKLCEYIEQFADEHIPPRYVQTFRGTGEVLKRIYDKYPECLGACMMGTSTCEDIWYPEDRELDEAFPYHFGTSSRHWEMFGDDHLAEGVPVPPPSEEVIAARQRKFVDAALVLFQGQIVYDQEVQDKSTFVGTSYLVADVLETLGEGDSLTYEDFGIGEFFSTMAKAFDAYPGEW